MFKRKVGALVNILFGMLFFVPNVYASQETKGVGELLDLPLESLLDLDIVTSAKKIEKISEASGVVSVVTAKDIRRYGAVTMVDVLRRMPGVFPKGASDIYDSMNSVRGMHSSSIDKHLLVLLNGRPMRDAYGGGINSAIYRGFPIEAIERLELVRGPGSVLYGSGAFAGVINIITKAPIKGGKTTTQLYTGYGSFNTKESGVTASGSYGNARYFVASRALRTDGFDFDAFDTAAVQGSDALGRNNHATTGQLYYKNITLSLMDAYTREDLLAPGAVFPFIHRTDRRKHLDAGYIYDLSDDLKAHFNLTYGNTAYGFSNGTVRGKSHDLLTEIYLQGEVSEKISVISGLSYDDLRGTTKANAVLLNSRNFRNIWKSAYCQFDLKPWHKVKVTLGGQYNQADDVADFSPRLGLVTHLNNNWKLKLLYGAAFRSPSGLETSFLLPGVITGNENLKPEYVETFDAQLFYKNNWLKTALTYFESKQENSIEVIFNPGIGLLRFENAGKTEFKGVEWELEASLNENWSVDGSLSFQKNKTDAGVVDSQYTPNMMAKLGVNYNNGKGLNIGVFDNYFGEPGRTENLQVTQSLNENGKKYHHLTTNLEFDLSKLSGNRHLSGMSLSIFGDNLLESDPVNYPDDTEREINALPLYGGRSVFARFKIDL